MKTGIEGLELKALDIHSDERGSFREVLRVTDGMFEGFGQWSHTMMYPGTIKAWHVHKIQTDYWYVPIGVIKAVLYDCRKESLSWKTTLEVYMGDTVSSSFVLKIPPGVAHGLKVVSPSVAHMFYITSHVYNPNDEVRLPHDAPDIGYDWLSPPKIT